MEKSKFKAERTTMKPKLKLAVACVLQDVIWASASSKQPVGGAFACRSDFTYPATNTQCLMASMMLF